MNYFKKTVLPVLLAGIWVNLSEFLRNEFLLKEYWTNHYAQMNQTFPSEPVNGIIWMIWGFMFAIVVFILSRKFNLLQTTLLSWFVGFVLMWLVIWNLNVLPIGIMYFAFPLSLLEAFLASWICHKLSPDQDNNKQSANWADF